MYRLGEQQPIELKHLIGKRIRTYWGQLRDHIEGVIVAHEGDGKFWVKYEGIEDENGEPYFFENLLTGRPPKWTFV